MKTINPPANSYSLQYKMDVLQIELLRAAANFLERKIEPRRRLKNLKRITSAVEMKNETDFGAVPRLNGSNRSEILIQFGRYVGQKENSTRSDPCKI